MAQATPPAYESVSIAQGLSQGMVFDIMQDKDDFIWIATKNGLNRYGGYDFNYEFRIMNVDFFSKRSFLVKSTNS